MSTLSDQVVAKTILVQLGGNKFLAMTGAKNLMSDVDSLSMKLPGKNFCKQDINYFKVKLNEMDTYDLEFGRVRGLKYKVVDQVSGIYCDQLQEVFTAKTGLYAHL